MSDASNVTLPASVVERLTGALERLEKAFSSAAGASSALSSGLMTITEVAARLRKSRRDVERMVADGKLKKVPGLGKRTTRFRPADVERLTADKEKRPGRRQL